MSINDLTGWDWKKFLDRIVATQIPGVLYLLGSQCANPWTWAQFIVIALLAGMGYDTGRFVVGSMIANKRKNVL